MPVGTKQGSHAGAGSALKTMNHRRRRRQCKGAARQRDGGMPGGTGQLGHVPRVLREALPFGDGAFDCVLSTFGSMSAPDHRRIAAEMLRVTRPGGRIGVAS
jgi:SAM-dependent methyltransferase